MKNKILKLMMMLAMVVGLASGVVNENAVSAAVTKDTGLEVKGNSQSITASQIGDDITVTFTFKTTHPDFAGFTGGTYAIKYDPDRMDYVTKSIRQTDGLANEDHTKFTVNGAAAEKGTILVSFATAFPEDDHDLTLKFKNLFKDGSRDPLKIEMINRTEDRFLVWDNTIGKLGNAYEPKTPIIEHAKISLTALGLTVSGSNSVEKGKTSNYTASLTNALNTTKGVTWAVEGGIATTIGADGKLTVGAGETATSVKVKATSVEDPTVSATKTVTLTTPPEVSVSVTGPNEVIKGTKTNFSATVSNATNKAVTWGVTGQTSAKTNVGSDGKLTVGLDETATELTLTATSVQNPAKKSTVKVNLKEKTYTIVSVKLPVEKIEMKSGTTEDELDAEAQKNNSAKVTIKTNDGKTYTIEVPTLRYESDKDVVGSDGVLVGGKFNLEYTMNLPYVEVDEEGKVTTSEKETNLIGKNTTSIPVGIGVKTTEEPSTGTNPGENTKPGDDKKPSIDVNPDGEKGQGTDKTPESPKTPIKQPVKTSDDSQLTMYVAGLAGCGALLAGLMMKRRKEKSRG